MKILQLCNKVPYPEKDGGAIGISVFTKALLSAGCMIKMLAMNTKKHYIDINSVPEQFRSITRMETVDLDTSVTITGALCALITRQSYNISRFRSTAFEQKLSSILEKEKFDIVQLEGLYLTSYIPVIRKQSSAPIILRAHNVEWEIWQKLSSEENNIVKKMYLRILANQLKRYEKQAINLCNGITTTTANDLTILSALGCTTPIAHIPFGIDIERCLPLQCTDEKSLFYLGALDWLPNIQGINWFLQNVWQKIHEEFPDVKFHIAGRNMPDEMKNKIYPGIVFHGEVEDAKAYMNQYNIMLVPLLAGSGVRVKIIESMAHEKPIITTSAGIEGIECVHGEDVLVANSPEEFYQAVKRCLTDSAFTKKLAQNGRKFAQAHHGIEKITRNLLQFYNERIIAK